MEGEVYTARTRLVRGGRATTKTALIKEKMASGRCPRKNFGSQLVLEPASLRRVHDDRLPASTGSGNKTAGTGGQSAPNESVYMHDRGSSANWFRLLAPKNALLFIRPESCDMDARVRSLIATMRQGLAGPISMGILSRAVNLSAARMRQLFKKHTGRSPMQYLRDLRMQKAEELLRSTFLSIKEVASVSGMTDVSHFVRDFKKEYGLTPSAFRAEVSKSAKTRGLRIS